MVPEGWVFEPLVEDELTVICAASHHLASAKEITAADLSACKWLLHRVGSASRQRYESFARRMISRIQRDAGWSCIFPN